VPDVAVAIGQDEPRLGARVVEEAEGDLVAGGDDGEVGAALVGDGAERVGDAGQHLHA
jgi:hypothetical protein